MTKKSILMKLIKCIPLAVITLFLFSCSSSGQLDLNKTMKDLGLNTNTNGTKPLSNEEVVQGLKEALNVGTNNSTASASKVDGYFKNAKIFIPFPPEAVKVKNTVEDLGMKPQVDKFVETLNRAAEEAAKEAAPIFLDAIKQMSIQDGFKILKGADNEATKYLQDKTTQQLHDKFKPVCQRATQKVEVTKYWNPVITTYNKVPLHQPLNPDLEEYITQRALAGLFTLVADEELKIRKDPVARVTDILKRVFGSN